MFFLCLLETIIFRDSCKKFKNWKHNTIPESCWSSELYHFKRVFQRKSIRFQKEIRCHRPQLGIICKFFIMHVVILQPGGEAENAVPNHHGTLVHNTIFRERKRCCDSSKNVILLPNSNNNSDPSKKSGDD